MTCKDCLHYGICYTQETCNDIEQQLKDFGCKDFANRSEWVHLPCKEGDILYEITRSKTVNKYRVKAVRVELFGIFIDWDIIEGFVERYITNVPASEIGRTVFLTREEAEKALNVLNK